MSPSKRARALEADSGSGSSDWEDSSVDSTQEGEDKDTLGEVSGHDQDEESGKEGDKGSSEEDSDEEVVDKEVSGGRNQKEKALREPCGGEIRYKNVHRCGPKYRAIFYKDGQKTYKYGFTTPEEAARERDRLAVLHEENPILNFLPDGSLNPERSKRAKGARRGDKERATVPRGDGLSATRPPPKDDKKAGNDGKETEEGEVRYRGVACYKGAYRARILVGRKDRLLGTFDCKEDAAKAVDRAELQQYGDAALLNFLPDGTLNPERLRKKYTRSKAADGDTNRRKRKAEAEGGKRKKQKPLPDVSEGGDKAEEGSGDGQSDEEDTVKRSLMAFEETEHTANLDGEEEGGGEEEEGATEQATRRRKTGKRHKERLKEKKGRRGRRPRRSESEAAAMDLGTALNILKAEAFRRGEECQALWRELEKLSDSLRDPTKSSEGAVQEYLYSFLAATVCKAYTEEQLHKQDLKEMILQAAMWTVVHSAGIQGEG